MIQIIQPVAPQMLTASPRSQRNNGQNIGLPQVHNQNAIQQSAPVVKTQQQQQPPRKSNFTIPVENKNFIPVQYVLVEQKVQVGPANKSSTPVTMSLPSVRCSGTLKFFDHNKGFGFLTLDDGSDVFLHHDDLLKANLD